MAVQFAGSSSTGNRRRRRLAASGEVSGIDASQIDGDGVEIESQLVASEAACPWVPVSETRIWIYSALIMVGLTTLAFASIRSDLFPAKLGPITAALFSGTAPVAIVQAQVLLLALSVQLGMLIGWYRARCMLDFAGRYRVWPWAVGLFAISAFCLATGSHRALGDIVGSPDFIPWRGKTVAWLLPLCVISLPITLFLDRDTRKNPSSVWMLRISETLWLAEAYLELYRPELLAQPWFSGVFLLIPLFASAALFIGLWHHARVVAYVYPDPPVLDEQSVWSLGLSVCRWVGRRMIAWKRTPAEVEDEEEEKPKRRRKKTATEEAANSEAAASKKKRKPAAKRATTARPRTRVKPADEESADDQVEVTEDEESTSFDESAATTESTSWEESSEQWEEEAIEEPPVPVAKSKGSNRVTQVHPAHSSTPPASHVRWDAAPEQEEAQVEPETSQSYSESSESDEDGQSYPGEVELTADQMRGLTKRQKRELKKQLRDQERNRKH